MTLIATIAAAVSVTAQQTSSACDGCRLRFSLALVKETCEVGEPIVLSVRVTNVGASAIALAHTSAARARRDGYSFRVFDDHGRQVRDPGRVALSLMEALGGDISLPPGATDQRQLTLNYQIAPLRPGVYTIAGSLKASEPHGVSAESNRVTVRVVPTPPERLRQRIAAIARDLQSEPRRAAALLGFTGDAAALPPLVGLLYGDDRGAAAAADALLYLDPDAVKRSLLEALEQRGPRERLVYALTPDALPRAALLRFLHSADATTRAAAVEGLRLSNRVPDSAIFAPLAAMLRDPDASVRQKSAAAIGGYANQQALTALAPAVDDADASVSEQATIAVGWVARAAAPGSGTRRSAMALLRRVARQQRGAVSEQARWWLAAAAAR